jgi:hypothetical protein
MLIDADWPEIVTPLDVSSVSQAGNSDPSAESSRVSQRVAIGIYETTRRHGVVKRMPRHGALVH